MVCLILVDRFVFVNPIFAFYAQFAILFAYFMLFVHFLLTFI